MPTIPKHAYLIMAHDNWPILRKLLLLLDDFRHDIFLHLDAKSEAFDLQTESLITKSKLRIIESKPVYWADYSVVETTLRLLKEAVSGKYSYYHLLSGADLPLKTNNERYRFFEDSQKNFIGIVPSEFWYSVRRVKYYHPLVHNRYYRTNKALKIADRLLEYGQRITGVNRLKGISWKIIDGWTWFSIRHDLCQELIEAEKMFNSMFHSTIASDELFIQTFVYNQPTLRMTLYDESNLKNGSMRYIDWKRGKPYTWGGEAKDYQLLMSSPYMFARKFSAEQSGELADRIFSRLMEEQNNPADILYRAGSFPSN